MGYDRFKLYDGKADVKKIGESKEIIEEIKGLDLIRLPSGRYLTDKAYLEKLKKCTIENLQKTPIYVIVAVIKNNRSEGDAIEITETRKLEKFLKEFRELR